MYLKLAAHVSCASCSVSFRSCLQWTVCWPRWGSSLRYSCHLKNCWYVLCCVWLVCHVHFISLFMFFTTVCTQRRMERWVGLLLINIRTCHNILFLAMQLFSLPCGMLQVILVKASLMWWTSALEDRTWSVGYSKPETERNSTSSLLRPRYNFAFYVMLHE